VFLKRFLVCFYWLKYMNRYGFDGKGRFFIEDYNKSRPFASFLPGIAGRKGIPLWVFYVNRVQCISSFGVQDKDHPIMEFDSAVRAYQRIRTHGFRTFIKIPGENVLYEPFTYRLSLEGHSFCFRVFWGLPLGTSTFAHRDLVSLWGHGWRSSPTARGSHLR